MTFNYDLNIIGYNFSSLTSQSQSLAEGMGIAQLPGSTEVRLAVLRYGEQYYLLSDADFNHMASGVG
jgi:hypothetical protein